VAGMTADALGSRWAQLARQRADVAIYRVDIGRDALDDVRALAGRAGMPVAELDWVEAGPVAELEYEQQVLTVFRPSGAVRWVDHRRWQVDDGESTMDLSDEDAFDAGLREIGRLDIAGDVTFVPRKVSRLNVASAPKGGPPTVPRVIDVGVVFGRVLDGLPVEGPGGCVVVYFDHELGVTGFERVARPVSRYEPVRGWRSLDDVLTATERYWRRGLRQGLEVRDARLAFVELGRLQEQAFLQPCYALALELADRESGQVRTVDHYEPAAVNGTGPVMPDTPEAPAAPRNR
jgi:hypothetical protein